MSGTEVLGLISAIITIVDATIQVSNAVKDETGLPPNFKTAATKLPLITKLLDDAERYVESSADNALTSAFTPVLTDCKEKATLLQQLFEKVIPVEGDSRFECYVKAARTIGKGGRVETLMSRVLRNLQLLTTKFPETVSRRGQEQLTKAVEEVSQMEPSLPEGFENAPVIAHYGSGAQNVNAGTGSQFNNNSTGNQNNGPGNQFIGTNHIVYASPANEDKATAKEAHFMVPFPPDRDFVARPSIERWVREQLKKASRVALIGMGGLGKSQIAIQLAHEVHSFNPEKSIFWVYGASRASFEGSFRSIADKLALPGRHNPKDNILELVRNWLQRDDVAPWLIILDNADNFNVFYGRTDESPLASYMPRNGQVLVTSRNLNVAEKLTGSHHAINHIPSMGCAEAFQLLRKKLISSFDEGTAAELIRCLDCIPLAVNQAAAYINRRRISIETYIQRFRDSDMYKMRLLQHDGGDIRRHESVSNSVAVTWQVTFDQILHESSAAANLLSLLSCFQPQNIPQHMLSGYNESLQSREIDGESLEDDMDVLLAYSLISTPTEPHIYEMHSLVQVCVRGWLSELGYITRWEKLFLQLASEHFPNGQFETWNECQLLLPHVERMLENQPDDEADSLRWGLLLTNISQYMNKKGDYNEGMVLAQKSVEVRKKLLRLGHPDTLTSMANLASTYSNQGRLEEAERLNVEVMETRKTKLGVDHPDTLTSIANLGSTLWSQGRLEEAGKLNAEVMETRKTKLGVDHPDTLTSIANLASTLWSQGRLEEAERLEVEVVETRKTKLGAGHPDTLTSMAHLASTYRDQGQWKDAERLEVEVIGTSKTTLGLDHPHTLASISNLALTYSKQGRWKEAEKLNVEVMETRKTKLGADHPSTLYSMNNLAYTLRRLGRPYEALKLMGNCASLRRHVLGSQHPDTESSTRAMEMWQQDGK